MISWIILTSPFIALLIYFINLVMRNKNIPETDSINLTNTPSNTHDIYLDNFNNRPIYEVDAQNLIYLSRKHDRNF